MSLPDQLERAGIVLGSILLVALPVALVLQVVVGPEPRWWSALVLLAPGFVVGWAVATEQAPFDYDSLWFVCFAGYVISLVVLASLNLEVTGADGGLSLGVVATAFVAAAVVNAFRASD